MSRHARVVGILAGGGSLPREIAEHVIARGGSGAHRGHRSARRDATSATFR